MSKPLKKCSKRMQMVSTLRKMAKDSKETAVEQVLLSAAASIEGLPPPGSLVNSEEIALMTEGKKILAVKSFRERMLAKGLKLGLRDCINSLNDEVEKHRRTGNFKKKQESGSSPAQKRGKGQRPKGKKSLKKDSK